MPMHSDALDLFGFTEPKTHDPGGRKLPLPPGVEATAVFAGPDDCYRYRMDWIWDRSRPALLAGMMNPSSASHLNGDSTVCWVHRWACRNGFGRLIVVNADAYRCKDQARLAEVDDPCGPDNLTWILAAAREADLIVLGYGQPKVRAVRGHGLRMARALAEDGRELHVWGLSADMTPKHPLYLPADVQADQWSPPVD